MITNRYELNIRGYRRITKVKRYDYFINNTKKNKPKVRIKI